MDLEENLHWVPADSLFKRLVPGHQCFHCNSSHDYVSHFDNLHAGECDEVGCNAL